ncbi:MAG TPA: hypothetical protein PK324_14750, partial [Nocardioides sp.]|nr:hypothetical protein [Nocardioides sp.]
MSKQDNQRLSIFDDDEPTEPSTEAAADAATDAGADPVDAEKTQVIPQLPADAANVTADVCYCADGGS